MVANDVFGFPFSFCVALSDIFFWGGGGWTGKSMIMANGQMTGYFIEKGDNKWPRKKNHDKETIFDHK